MDYHNIVDNDEERIGSNRAYFYALKLLGN